jgi:hypothetical protein
MNPVNSESVHATIDRVHAIAGQVHATFSRVPATVGRVPTTVGRVPLIVGRRRGRLPHSTILVSHLIESNLVPRTCFTNGLDMSGGL